MRNNIDELISDLDDAELIELLHKVADEIELRMMQLS